MCKMILLFSLSEDVFFEVGEIAGCEVSPVGESIDCILRGGVPAGYNSIPFINSMRRLKIGVSSKLVGKLQGCTDTLLVYEITNRTCVRRKIREKEIACTNAQWAFLQKNCLNPNEKILAIVAVQNE
jgi:hypothetical protein